MLFEATVTHHRLYNKSMIQIHCYIEHWQFIHVYRNYCATNHPSIPLKLRFLFRRKKTVRLRWCGCRSRLLCCACLVFCQRSNRWAYMDRKKVTSHSSNNVTVTPCAMSTYLAHLVKGNSKFECCPAFAVQITRPHWPTLRPMRHHHWVKMLLCYPGPTLNDAWKTTVFLPR